MICEHCKNVYTEIYASGRFCSKKCSKSFSTAKNRSDINLKVSEKMKGKPANNKGKKQTNDQINKRMAGYTTEKRRIASNKLKETFLQKHNSIKFEDLKGKASRKKRIFIEQNGECHSCHLSEWLNKPITLELEHIDGNNKNNERSNLKLLCCNCHSYTPTWRRIKK